MSKSSIRKEIAALINSIKEHSDNIGDKDHIPQIELELILHKIEKLYQKSIVFNHLNSLSEDNDGDTVKRTEPLIEKKSPEPVAEIKKEPVKTELVDLFGNEIPAADKPKMEKKAEKKDDLSAEKTGKPAAKSIQKPAITDLTKAIGLNDKFQFANDLFEGSMQEYSIAIQQLNSAGTLESAMDYFSNLQQLYEWDMEKEIVKRLIDLVDRRYS